MIQHLSWDTGFFGLEVGRLELAGGVIPDAAGYDLVYIVTDPENAPANEAAAAAGAILVDEKVTFLKSITPAAATDPDIISYTSGPGDEGIIGLGLQSGIYSRFRVDARLPEGSYERLYTAWMENSIQRKIAWDVLAFIHEGNAAGLLTLGTKSGRADIGILAVDGAARGQRIGSRLVAQSELAAAAAGYTEIQVVTQLANTTACQFYRSCGFNAASIQNIYHLWKR